MTEEQKTALRCAFADLCGSLQAYQQGDLYVHDWAAHRLTVYEIKQAFGDLLDAIPADIDNYN